MITYLVIEVTQKEIDAAAKAWLEWQFSGATWEKASESMKAKFRDGAMKVLKAAASVRTD